MVEALAPAGSLAYALATGEDQLMGDGPVFAPEVFVGVDVAKGRHYACAVSAWGVMRCFVVRFLTTTRLFVEWLTMPGCMAVRRWWLIRPRRRLC